MPKKHRTTHPWQRLQSTSIDAKRLALIRRADTAAATTHGLGGREKVIQRRKPVTLVKMPWDEK